MIVPHQRPTHRGAIATIAIGLGIGGVAWFTWPWFASRPGPAPSGFARSELPTQEATTKSLQAAALDYRGAAPVPFLTDKKSSRPLHTKSKYPTGTRIPVRIAERPKQGIPCPDGTFLPFLNGMTAAPALQRDPAYGPVPPIVAIVVDADGIEWWEHADGSTTTCHYIGVTAHGESYFDPTTRHALPKPASQVLGADLSTGPGDPGSGTERQGNPPKRN